jgi:hypothetical protein
MKVFNKKILKEDGSFCHVHTEPRSPRSNFGLGLGNSRTEHARVGREPDRDADHVTSRPLGHSEAGKSSPLGIRIDVTFHGHHQPVAVVSWPEIQCGAKDDDSMVNVTCHGLTAINRSPSCHGQKSSAAPTSQHRVCCVGRMETLQTLDATPLAISFLQLGISKRLISLSVFGARRARARRPPATVSVAVHTTRDPPRGNQRQCTLTDQAAERLNSARRTIKSSRCVRPPRYH